MTAHATLTEAIKDFWRKIRGENPKRSPMQSELDLARADWEGMGQGRYAPPDVDGPASTDASKAP